MSEHNPASDDNQCVYPGCEQPRRDDDADVCRRFHSGKRAPGQREPDPYMADNDGLVDEEAIWIAFRGIRRVRLSWVERDIVIAMMLGAGMDVKTIAEHTGYLLDKTGDKYRRLAALGRRYFDDLRDNTAA